MSVDVKSECVGTVVKRLDDVCEAGVGRLQGAFDVHWRWLEEAVRETKKRVLGMSGDQTAEAKRAKVESEQVEVEEAGGTTMKSDETQSPGKNQIFPSEMKVVELREELGRRCLPKGGLKAVLVKRLQDALKEEMAQSIKDSVGESVENFKDAKVQKEELRQCEELEKHEETETDVAEDEGLNQVTIEECLLKDQVDEREALESKISEEECRKMDLAEKEMSRQEEAQREQERIQHEKVLAAEREDEQERLGKFRLDEEKFKKETVESEDEQERLEKAKEKLQKEKAEKERLTKEADNARRLAKEQAEKEKAEKERVIRERLEKEKMEILRERERQAKERLEEERIREEKAKMQRQRLEKEQQDRVDRLRRLKFERERLEQEKFEQGHLVQEKREKDNFGKEMREEEWRKKALLDEDLQEAVMREKERQKKEEENEALEIRKQAEMIRQAAQKKAAEAIKTKNVAKDPSIDSNTLRSKQPRSEVSGPRDHRRPVSMHMDNQNIRKLAPSNLQVSIQGVRKATPAPTDGTIVRKPSNLAGGLHSFTALVKNRSETSSCANNHASRPKVAALKLAEKNRLEEERREEERRQRKEEAQRRKEERDQKQKKEEDDAAARAKQAKIERYRQEELERRKALALAKKKHEKDRKPLVTMPATATSKHGRVLQEPNAATTLASRPTSEKIDEKLAVNVSDKESTLYYSGEESLDSESSDPEAKFPAWSRKENLNIALDRQFATGVINPETIFPDMQATCDLEAIFKVKKKRFLKRSDSGNWNRDKASKKDKDEYNKDMGFE